MPATVTRSRENTAETRERFQTNGHSAHEYDVDFVASSHVSGAPAPQDHHAEDNDRESGVEWQQVAPLVDRFTTEVPEAERKRRRGLRKRHRNFVMSSVFWVGLLFGVELVGLVFLYSTDLRAIRYEKSLQTQIDKTTLDKNLADNQLAASVSPAKLDMWAGQLGYHKAQLTEMDDVTSSAPMTASPKPAATP